MQKLFLIGCLFANVASGMRYEGFFHLIDLISEGKDTEAAKFYESKECSFESYLAPKDRISTMRDNCNLLLKVLSDCTLKQTNPTLHEDITQETQLKMLLCEGLLYEKEKRKQQSLRTTK